MSKYTTELRYLIEMGYDLGLSSYPIFDETYRAGLNTKIINHYKFREIGFETAGLFVDRLNVRMAEIMPYYNLLYKSSLLKFDPLINNNYTENYTKHFTGDEDIADDNTRVIDGKVNATANTTGESKQVFDQGTDSTEKDTFSETQDSEDHSKTVGSDTPQGMLLMQDIESQTWASNAAISEGTGKIVKSGESDKSRNDAVQSTTDNNSTTDTTSESTSKDTNVYNGTISRDTNNWETLERKIEGLQGVSASELLKQFRETFLNIDMMVINDLNELFMGVF